MNYLLGILVTLAIAHVSLQDTDDNLVYDESPINEAINSIKQEQNLQNLGGKVLSFLENGGGKEIADALGNLGSGPDGGNIGSILTNLAANGGVERTAELLQNMGSLLNKKGDDSGGLDPQLLTNIMMQLGQLKQNQNSNDLNAESIISMITSFLGQSGNSQSLFDYLPSIIDTMNSFLGPEAENREREHAGHAWSMPPLVEKFHVLFDHFMHSEMGKTFMNTLGAEKFVKIFADENGNISYQKVVDMFENHSFRKHWIRMVTDRIAYFIDRYSDPRTHKQLVNNIQIFVNSWLRNRGYPKSVLFDTQKPVESLTALINYISKVSFNERISSRQYVQPAVEYFQELFRLSQSVHSGGDHTILSNKIADTINLEIIEPIARVNRAYRFAKKNPECDKYVFCLVNDKSSNEKSASLPGLRQSLSKVTSVILGWFLSSTTGTSYWSLYGIVQEDQPCQQFYKESCEAFHIEEYKVTTEYVHNEL